MMHRWLDRACGCGALIIIALFLVGCQADEAEPARTITVTGYAQVSNEPDVATVHFGFWNKDEDPNRALADAQAELQGLTAALVALGLDPADIQPMPIGMSSEQIPGPDGYPTDRLLYAVNQSVTVSVRDLDRLADALNAIRGVVGAPYIYSLSVNQDQSEQRRARVLAASETKALEDAQARAGRMAQTLGLALGEPLEIVVTVQNMSPTAFSLGQTTVRVVFGLL
jgi:hypothetical protein